MPGQLSCHGVAGDVKPSWQVEQDVRRISTRNLGRDDRVVGDHAREGRYPFLDEDVVDYVSRLPLHVKVGVSTLGCMPFIIARSFRLTSQLLEDLGRRR